MWLIVNAKLAVLHDTIEENELILIANRSKGSAKYAPS